MSFRQQLSPAGGVASSDSPAEVATYPLDEHIDCAVFVDGNGDSERWFAHNSPPRPLEFGESVLQHRLSPVGTDTEAWIVARIQSGAPL